MPLSTPLHVSLLVHYNGVQSEFPTRGAPAVEEYIGHLLKARLIKRRSKADCQLVETMFGARTAKFKTTPKGKEVVDNFCAVLAQAYSAKVAKAIYFS